MFVITAKRILPALFIVLATAAFRHTDKPSTEHAPHKPLLRPAHVFEADFDLPAKTDLGFSNQAVAPRENKAEPLKRPVLPANPKKVRRRLGLGRKSLHRIIAPKGRDNIWPKGRDKKNPFLVTELKALPFIPIKHTALDPAIIAHAIRVASYPLYIHNDLYKIMDKLHRICTDFGLDYYPEGGTAIGIMRHGGIIPWDDDLDIHMMESTRQRLLDADLKQALEDHGLVLHPDPNLFKVTLKDPGGPQKAWIDIFSVEEKPDGRITHTHKWAFDAWGATAYWLPDELEGVTQVPFGPTCINVPKGLRAHSNRDYPGWDKELVIFGGHLKRDSDLARQFEGVPIPALPEYCKPAPWRAEDWPNAPHSPL